MNRSKSFPDKFKENSVRGWGNGFIGVLIFSGALPAMRVAVMKFNPVFLTFTRATIAGLLALFILLISKEKRPLKSKIIPLLIVSIGCVVGFPLLTALALKYITSAHSLFFIGVLPLATAIFRLARGGERPRPAFWIFSILGSLFIIGYTLAGGITSSPVGDTLMVLAICLCGLGYSEGAILSKTLGE
jgi:drug/metabolite transporter (DMT)-like permease